MLATSPHRLFLAALLLGTLATPALAQDNTLEIDIDIEAPEAPVATPAPAEPAAASPVKLEFYLDAYYGIDTDSHMTSGEGAEATRVPRTERALNAVNYRRNEFNLNTAQVSASTQMDWFRGRTTLQFGNIAHSSWIPSRYSAIQEANLGIRPLSNLGAEGNDLWIDGGIFLTHIGNEALLPRYNWLSNLALVTMYEPFYQSGLRASYNWGSMLNFQLHVLNGYGNIEDNNGSKSVGWLVGYNPLNNLGLAWTGVVGDESNAGDPGFVRFYNNFNLNYQILDDLGLRGQFDVATQSDKGLYYGAQLTGRYDFLEDFGVTLRGETIQDANGMLTPDKLQGFGVTLGLEYRPLDNAFVRLEGRQLWLDATNNAIFMDANGNRSSQRTEFSANTGFWF
ncbi:MAG: outer membrane beta-barrel protein [Candidatus Sericytochromatia bacterium]